MKRLPPAKRNQLIIVLLVTAAAISAVYLFLISPQKQDNLKLAGAIADKQAALDKMRATIRDSIDTSNRLAEASVNLARAETDIATGDAYAWTYDAIRRFKSAYAVDLPSIGSPVIGEVDAIPNFPYKQIRVSLIGTAYYSDLGKFTADFENNFPHMRIINLTIEPADPGGANEKLSFRMDVAALVKPNS